MHNGSGSSVGACRRACRALLAAALALGAAPASAQLALAVPVPPLAAPTARAKTPAAVLLIPVAGVTAEQLHDSYHAGREGGRCGGTARRGRPGRARFAWPSSRA